MMSCLASESYVMLNAPTAFLKSLCVDSLEHLRRRETTLDQRGPHSATGLDLRCNPSIRPTAGIEHCVCIANRCMKCHEQLMMKMF